MPLIQYFSWAGAEFGIASLEYTVSHSVSPAVAVIQTIPAFGQEAPFEFGDLIFGDGDRQVILKDCKADKLTPSVGPEGTSWLLEILDRRWRWLTGAISGIYNEMDNNSKLNPLWIRSPVELATLCLEAMGEKDYVIDLPDGVEQAEGKDFNTYLLAGENFQERGINPYVVWDKTNPAQALARLVEPMGRRVILQLAQNRVIIAQLGEGEPLPDGPCEVITDTIDAPETPVSLNVAGAYIRYQGRFELEMVGEEWDLGHFVPVDNLSYSPLAVTTSKPMIFTVTYVGADVNGAIEIKITKWNASGTGIEYDFRKTDGGVTALDKLAEIRDEINATAGLAQICKASLAGSILTLTGTAAGVVFGVEAFDPFHLGSVNSTIQLGQAPESINGWQHDGPGQFPGVRATTRLSKVQAQELARKWVWRAFRIVEGSEVVFDDRILVPGFGRIDNRLQLILQPNRVEQIVPDARDPGGDSKPFQGVGILPPYYDGRSRDMRARCLGAISRNVGTVHWTGSGLNTPVGSEIRVGFTIDPQQQLVIFDEPIFANNGFGYGAAFLYPKIILETAVLVRDIDTGTIQRYEVTREIGGKGPPLWEIHDDVQIGRIGKYDADGILIGTSTILKDDADMRASRWLDGMEKRYVIKGGETRQYIGIRDDVDLDGLRQQVTYSLGGNGPTTIASTNCEHSSWIAPYTRRRLAENLPPNAAAVLANLVHNKTFENVTGFVAGAVTRLF